MDDARRIASTVLNTLEGYPYRTKDWGEMNRNLFSALRLEKLVMGIILSIIVVVAAGLIVATVIMLVLEKRKEISVLKALGVPDGGIVKIFLAEGLQIGLAGGILGLFSGLAWCLFIEKVGLRLDPEVYYIPSLPVKIEPLQTALTVLIAILVTYLASIYPALQASRVEPVEGLKARVGAPMAFIEIRDVFKSYWLHGKRIDVLRGLSLDIEQRRAGQAGGRLGLGEEHLPPRAGDAGRAGGRDA